MNRWPMWMLLLACLISGCGGLKYSEHSMVAEKYHPKSVAVLPALVGDFEQAHDVVERQVALDLIDRGWFDRVVYPSIVQSRMREDAELRDRITHYLSTLRTVGQSAPELLTPIGAALGVESVVVVSIQYWGYTRQEDDKVGKVGLGLKFMETAGGKILYRAAHEEVEDYMLFKPDLAEISEKVLRKIIDDMPH